MAMELVAEEDRTANAAELVATVASAAAAETVMVAKSVAAVLAS